MPVRSSARPPIKNLPPDVLAFSPKALIGMLPLGRHAIYALARRIGIRSGRRLLIPRQALEAWLSGRTNGGTL